MLTSRGDQVNAGILRKNARPNSNAITARTSLFNLKQNELPLISAREFTVDSSTKIPYRDLTFS
jgi:hypothetical protein